MESGRISRANLVIGVDGTYSSAALHDVKVALIVLKKMLWENYHPTIKARPTIISNTPSGDPLAIQLSWDQFLSINMFDINRQKQ